MSGHGACASWLPVMAVILLAGCGSRDSHRDTPPQFHDGQVVSAEHLRTELYQAKAYFSSADAEVERADLLYAGTGEGCHCFVMRLDVAMNGQPWPLVKDYQFYRVPVAEQAHQPVRTFDARAESWTLVDVGDFFGLPPWGGGDGASGKSHRP